MKIISGEYNESGYSVWDGHGIVYTTGNHREDSQQSAMCERDRLPLHLIRRYCIRTTREIAKECGGRYAGVEYNEVAQ